MPLFYDLMNRREDVQKFKDSLETLKSQGKTLLDASEVEVDGDELSTFFDELMNSNFLRSAYRPSEILQSIVDAGLAFNITEQQLAQLYNNNLQLQVLPNHATKKADDLVAEVLVENFGVNAQTMVAGQTIFDRHLGHTTPARLVKTLRKLIELDLIPQEFGERGVVQIHQVGANRADILQQGTTDNLIVKVAQKVTSANLPDVVELLKDKCDQSLLAHKFLESNRLSIVEVLTMFHEHGVNLDLNQDNAWQDNSILTFIIHTSWRIFENGGVNSFRDVLSAARKHQPDWPDNFASQILSHISPHIIDQFLPEIINAFADCSINLSANEIEVGNLPALDIIRNHMNGNYDSPIGKDVITSIAGAGVSFQDALLWFRDKVHMHDLVRAYSEKAIEVDFNAASPEFTNAMIYPMGMMMRIDGIFRSAMDYGSLLGHVFGQHVNNKDQFYKLIKQLKKFDNIDWTQELSGMGNNILAQIGHFDGIQQDATKLLRTAKEKYGLKFKINSFDLLQTLIEQIREDQAPEQIMQEITDLGFEINGEMAILAYAHSRGVSLSDAKALMGIEAVGGGLNEIKIKDLGSIAHVVMNSKNVGIISANLKQLKMFGFNKWNDGTNNATFLHMMIDQCQNFQEMNDFILALNRTSDISWDLIRDCYGRTAVDKILMQTNVDGAAVINNHCALNLIKLLKKFGVNDWVEVVAKIVNSLTFTAPGISKMEIVKALPGDVDFAKQNNGQSLFIQILRCLDGHEYVECLKQLSSLHVSDWNLIAKEMLDFNLANMNIVEKVKFLATKDIDFASEEGGSYLLADVVGRIYDHPEMIEVFKILKTCVDFTQIQNQRLFLLSSLQQYMLDLQQLGFMFAEERIIINWQELLNAEFIGKMASNPSCNLNAIALSLEAVGVRDVDWGAVASPEFLQKMISNSSENIMINLRFLLQNAPRIDWFNMQDAILLKVKQFGTDWQELLNLVSETRDGHLPKFNINFKESPNGQRLMDLARVDQPEVIKSLRDRGSVEPSLPIVIVGVDNIEKLDLSNERLDGYEPNKNNAPKILEALYAKFPLGGNVRIDELNVRLMSEEEHMNHLINSFKLGDFDGWENREWFTNRVMSIVEIVDALSDPAFQAIDDRAVLNNQDYYWGFKKVLASIIHVINKHDQHDIMRNNLVHCLSELKMCNLGKLINLLYVVQDVVLDDLQVNYESINLQDGAFADFLDIVHAEIINECGADQAAVRVAKWYFDMKGGNVNQAHTWSPETQYVHGVMNRLFDAFVIEAIGAEAGKVESYHFTNGLVGQVIAPFVEILGQDAQVARFADWKNLLEQGEAHIIKEFFETCVNVQGTEELERLFEDMSMNKLKLYGDFHAVDLDCIKEYFNMIRSKHHQDGLENKFIELLRYNCELSCDLALLQNVVIHHHEVPIVGEFAGGAHYE